MFTDSPEGQTQYEQPPAGAASALDDRLGTVSYYLNKAAATVPTNCEVRITLEGGEVRVMGINHVGGVTYVKNKFKDCSLSPTDAVCKAIASLVPNAEVS